MMPPQGQMPPGMMQQQMPGHYSQPPPPQMPPQHRYEDQQRMSGPYGGADNRSNAGSDYRQPSGGGGRQTSGGGRKDDGMPAPIHKEFPCRVLFVRNVCYDCPESEIKNMFAAFGEVKKFYSILETRGMAFITYVRQFMYEKCDYIICYHQFDLRDAERAKNELQGSEVRGRRIDVHYSLPKDEELETKVCDREKNQVCIIICRMNIHVKLQPHRELVLCT